MNYVTLDQVGAVSVFDICQAHQQLEADYNKGGWLRERPSNRRRMEATSVQLSRMQYRAAYRWTDICGHNDADDGDDENVRDIYLINVLKWGLPMDDEMRAFIGKRYTTEFLATFPHWSAT